MTHRGRYPAEVRERAVRLVREHEGDHPSQWAAITSIAAKCGMTTTAVDPMQAGELHQPCHALAATADAPPEPEFSVHARHAVHPPRHRVDLDDLDSERFVGRGTVRRRAVPPLVSGKPGLTLPSEQYPDLAPIS